MVLFFEGPSFRIHEVDSTLIWDDVNSGAKHNFACYAPSLASTSNLFVIGHFGISENRNGLKPKTYVVSLARDVKGNPVFQYPISYSLIWRDAGSFASKDGSFWKVNCPEGYGSLSDLCQIGYTSPNLDAIYCINQDYLEDDQHGNWIWDDTASGAAKDVDINGGDSELTKELVAATTQRGETKSLNKIKSEYLGISKAV